MVYAVDFDGTLCENRWPEIGAPNRPLIQFLISEQNVGAELILWTMREGAALNAAVAWCHGQGLDFDAVNDNTERQKRKYGNNPRKVYADRYIDDHNFEVKRGNQMTATEFYEKILAPDGRAAYARLQRQLESHFDLLNHVTPARILKSGKATIVFWRDGTKTVVKRGEDEPDSDYNAFLAALGIKYFGSNSALKRIVARTETQKQKEQKTGD